MTDARWINKPLSRLTNVQFWVKFWWWSHQHEKNRLRPEESWHMDHWFFKFCLFWGVSNKKGKCKQKWQKVADLWIVKPCEKQKPHKMTSQSDNVRQLSNKNNFGLVKIKQISQWDQGHVPHPTSFPGKCTSGIFFLPHLSGMVSNLLN